jgi:hypothetical protein
VVQQESGSATKSLRNHYSSIHAGIELEGISGIAGEYLKLAEGKRPDKIVLKWFMDTMWLRLSLSERKIAIILVTFSSAEILLLVVLVIAWNLFILR